MTVREYIKLHCERTHELKRVKYQCRGILQQQVMEGGNDIYLAAILDKNRAEIEELANAKAARA